MTDTYTVTRRDNLVVKVVNWILRTFATKEYRDMLSGSVRYGVASAMRDAEEGREAPQAYYERLKEQGIL